MAWWPFGKDKGKKPPAGKPIKGGKKPPPPTVAIPSPDVPAGNEPSPFGAPKAPPRTLVLGTNPMSPEDLADPGGPTLRFGPDGIPPTIDPDAGAANEVGTMIGTPGSSPGGRQGFMGAPLTGQVIPDGDPFGAPAADPFGSVGAGGADPFGFGNGDPFGAAPGGDPFGGPALAGDPFGAAPGGDPFGGPAPGGDPFGGPEPGGDPFGGPAPGGDPFGGPEPGGDPFGRAPSSESFGGSDPFGAPTGGADPFASPSPDGGQAGAIQAGAPPRERPSFKTMSVPMGGGVPELSPSAAEPAQQPGSPAGAALPMTEEKKQMARALLASGPVTVDMLDRALEESGKKGGKLGQALLRCCLPSEEELLLHYAQTRILKINIHNTRIPLETLKLIPKRIALSARALAVDKIGSILIVVTPEASNAEAMFDIRAATQCLVLPIQCAPEGFDEIASEYYDRLAEAGMADEEPAPVTTSAGDAEVVRAIAISEREMSEGSPGGEWDRLFASEGPIPAVSVSC